MFRWRKEKLPPKRVFLSSRINEMQKFNEAALKAIQDSGMEAVNFHRQEDLLQGVSLIGQLLDGVRTSDAFVGIYGQTLAGNWIPPGESRHSMEIEYETALDRRMPLFCYVVPEGSNIDSDMQTFRKRVMNRAVIFLTTPEALYESLCNALASLKNRIFISYSSNDSTFVDDLFDRLRDSGHSSWLNTQSIEKGDKWHSSMVRGLRNTDLMILVVSSSSMSSKWVMQEWQNFLRMKKKIIPVLLEECTVPPRIKAIEMVKVSSPDWFNRVLKAIEQNL